MSMSFGHRVRSVSHLVLSRHSGDDILLFVGVYRCLTPRFHVPKKYILWPVAFMNPEALNPIIAKLIAPL